MVENLNLTLATDTAVVASKNDGSTFSFTPTSCESGGACPMNHNTTNAYYGSTWVYNWYAATAGQGGLNIGAIDGSICPKGWRLPDSYEPLLQTYNFAGTGSTTRDEIIRFESTPLSFTQPGLTQGGSGWFSETMASYATSYGYNAADRRIIWYSSRDSDDIFIYASAGSSKASGGRVRCVAN